MNTATATDVRRWIAGRLGVSQRRVALTQPVVDNFNRHNPNRPYAGPVAPRGYRVMRAA